MKIKYKFNNGETSEVEVSEEIGEFIVNSRRIEEASIKKENRHNYSLEAIIFEGEDYATCDEYPSETQELKDRIQRGLSALSKLQKKRLLMFANGLSIREIARIEGKDFKTILESINGARNNFLKNF